MFDKNVLLIKKLVCDIEDLSKLIHKEQNKFFLCDDSNIITHTFFTEVNKKLQSYGLISLEYDQINNILNSKNKLKFNMLNKVQKEFITLQLEDILTLKRK